MEREIKSREREREKTFLKGRRKFGKREGVSETSEKERGFPEESERKKDFRKNPKERFSEKGRRLEKKRTYRKHPKEKEKLF